MGEIRTIGLDIAKHVFDAPSLPWTPSPSSRGRERCFDDEDEAGVFS